MTGTVLEVTNFEAAPEEWEFRPLQGAEVVVYWEGYRPISSDSGQGYCLAITHTTSDSNGRFHVEGRSVPRKVDGITEISAVSLAYVPGFVELRPHEHNSAIWADMLTGQAGVHVFRRADANSQDVREEVFNTARFCPSNEFRDL